MTYTVSGGAELMTLILSSQNRQRAQNREDRNL